MQIKISLTTKIYKRIFKKKVNKKMSPGITRKKFLIFAVRVDVCVRG